MSQPLLKTACLVGSALVIRAILVRIAVLCVAALVVLSLQPWRPGTRHHGGGAYRVAVHDLPHFLAYFCTALLLILIARNIRQRIFAPLAVVALGVALESAQQVLYRGSFEWRDLANDACAALLAYLLARFCPLRKNLVR